MNTRIICEYQGSKVRGCWSKMVMTCFAFVLLCCCNMSCENDPYLFCDIPTVRLVGDKNWTLETDSAIVSFQTFSTDEMDFPAEVCIIGNVEDRDRYVNLEVDAARTDAPSNLYEFPLTVKVPAGQASGRFFIKLRKDESLKSRAVSLGINVISSDDFEVGVREDRCLLIRWNDMVSKPLYWDRLVEFFGEYSDVKYRFILQVLSAEGYDTNFNTETGLTWGDYYNFRMICANKLAEYNATHSTPLTDENGVVVTF